MRRIIVFLLFVFPAALWAQVVITPDSAKVDSLRSAALQNGELLPFNTFPASLVDLQSAYDTLFPLGTDDIKGAKQWVHPGIYGRFGFDLNLDATISGSLNSFWNDYSNYLTSAEPFSVIRLALQDEKTWGIFVKINLEQQFNNTSTSAFPPDETVNPNYTYHTNLPIPIPGARSVTVDSHWIAESYLWFNASPLEITIGRQKLQYGPLENSLMISDNIPFLDMIRLHLPMGQWNFDYGIASLERRLGGGGSNITDNAFLITHRIDWGLPGLRIGFVEQDVLDRSHYDSNGNVTSQGVYSITDFLPIISYHQADIDQFNTMVAFDVEWAVAPDWRIMGQFGLDEIDGRDFGIPDDPIPTTPAFIFGTELQGRNTSFKWRWYSEVGWTHYLWGNFYSDYAGSKSVYDIVLDDGTAQIPLTSPYGPGSSWLNTKLMLTGENWTAGISVELWNTENGITLYSYYGYTGGTGHFGSTWNTRVKLLGTYKTGPVEWSVQPALLAQNTTLFPLLTVGAHLSFNVSEHEND